MDSERETSGTVVLSFSAFCSAFASHSHPRRRRQRRRATEGGQEGRGRDAVVTTVTADVREPIGNAVPSTPVKISAKTTSSLVFSMCFLLVSGLSCFSFTTGGRETHGYKSKTGPACAGCCTLASQMWVDLAAVATAGARWRWRGTSGLILDPVHRHLLFFSVL